jgi:hypothetical protein
VNEIQWVDQLGAELARVAARRHRRAWRPAVAAGLAVAMVVSAGAYAVPATRTAVGNVVGWLAGDDASSPGRDVRASDHAPDFVKRWHGRLITETDGVRFYVLRLPGPYGQPSLAFAAATSARNVFVVDMRTVKSLRREFRRFDVIVLGDVLLKGRSCPAYPFAGLTSPEITKVELTYATGPPSTAEHVKGAFVVMADGKRDLEELVAYDGSGRVVERDDVGGPSPEINRVLPPPGLHWSGRLPRRATIDPPAGLRSRPRRCDGHAPGPGQP